MAYRSNKLVNMYQQNNNSNYNNNPFQNNFLLQNSPVFSSNFNNTAQQFSQIQLQKIKQLEQLDESNVDKGLLKQSIINPIKVTKTREDRIKVERDLKEVEKNYRGSSSNTYGSEIQNYWKKRTNAPYKNIMKDQDYTRNFKSEKDLVVHRVTTKDKEGVEEAYTDMKSKKELHNNELKVIYSTSKQNEHKKKFEYNHVYKYRMQYDPKNHDDLKEDKIKYYKEQQKKEEVGKQKRDDILESLANDGIMNSLISNGIFNKDELDGLNSTKKTETKSNSIKTLKVNIEEKKAKYKSRKV
jgi:hypothetical protein